MTPDPSQIAQSTSFHGTEQVHIGNGQGLNITSIGSSQFSSPMYPTFTFALNNMLFVPSITKNLVFVSRFAKDNRVYFEFHPTCCLVKCQVSNRVLLEGHLNSKGLYYFQPLKFLLSSSTVTPPSANTTIMSTTPAIAAESDFFSTYTLWHRRLGHAHANAVRTILDLCKVSYQNKTVSDFCNACCLGKAHRLHSPLSNTLYIAPFELIHSDLWGPAPYTSTCGYSYYITFVDAFTRYTWIYFLKQKSDAIVAFNQFYTLISIYPIFCST